MSTIMVAQNPPALRLHGRVGFDETRPHFTAEAVCSALGQLRGKGRVAVSLNSTGGNHNESVAIAAALNAHPDGVEVIVEGVALSGAAFITCAVPQSAIAPGSTMMLHRASIDGKTSAKAAAQDRVRLDAFDRSNAELIARKTGRPLSAVHEMLKAETWFTAEEAVKAGLVGRMMGEPEAPSYPDECRDPAVLAEMACLAEQPAMAAVLIRDGASVAEARQRLDTMATIGPMLAMMEHKPGISAALKDKVTSGRLSIAEARTALFDALADEDEKIVVDNKRLTGSGSPDGKAMMRESMIKQIEQKHGPEAAAKARSKLKEGKAR